MKKLDVFPSQFNSFGQRTNSGVSIFDWEKVILLCEREVTQLVIDGSGCASVKVKNTSSKEDADQGGSHS
jgi:hypothetical protein